MYYPQPIGTLIPMHASSLFIATYSLKTYGLQPHPRRLSTWTIPRESFIHSPCWKSLTSYALLILYQGIILMTSGSTYFVNNSSLISQTSWLFLLFCKYTIFSFYWYLYKFIFLSWYIILEDQNSILDGIFGVKEQVD